MKYKDLITLLIIFFVFTISGVRIAEEGMYSVMGLEIEPKSFCYIFKDHSHTFEIMGKHYTLQRLHKIGEFYADRYKITLDLNGKKVSFSPLIYTGVSLKNRVNLDKKHANMYN